MPVAGGVRPVSKLQEMADTMAIFEEWEATVDLLEKEASPVPC